MPKYLESTLRNTLVKHIIDWLFPTAENLREVAREKELYDLFTEEFYNIADKFRKEGYVLETEGWKGDAC